MLYDSVLGEMKCSSTEHIEGELAEKRCESLSISRQCTQKNDVMWRTEFAYNKLYVSPI